MQAQRPALLSGRNRATLARRRKLVPRNPALPMEIQQHSSRSRLPRLLRRPLCRRKGILRHAFRFHRKASNPACLVAHPRELQALTAWQAAEWAAVEERVQTTALERTE